MKHEKLLGVTHYPYHTLKHIVKPITETVCTGA